jgi:hypothetical protein
MIREIWFAVAGVNLIAQVWYFFADENRMLYAAKRITTPLLLLLAFVFSLINRGGLTLIPGTILLAIRYRGFFGGAKYSRECESLRSAGIAGGDRCRRHFPAGECGAGVASHIKLA